MKNPKKTPHVTSYLLLAAYFLSAFVERTVFDLGPNIELVTMAMLLSAFYLGKKQSFWLTFAIIAFTDRVIGNSNIFLFTWSGFLLPALFANGIIRKLTTSSKLLTAKKMFTVLPLAIMGIGSNIFFYLWTNFGVWLLSSMYPHTAAGLVQSYINALPFLRYQTISTLLFVPAGFLATELATYIVKNYQIRVRVQGIR
jgi:hypothetical protein